MDQIKNQLKLKRDSKSAPSSATYVKEKRLNAEDRQKLQLDITKMQAINLRKSFVKPNNL